MAWTLKSSELIYKATWEYAAKRLFCSYSREIAAHKNDVKRRNLYSQIIMALSLRGFTIICAFSLSYYASLLPPVFRYNFTLITSRTKMRQNKKFRRGI